MIQKSTLIKTHKKTNVIMAKIKFYLPKEILKSKRFKDKASKAKKESRTKCSYKICSEYIEFSDAFLGQRPFSLIPDILLREYLEKKTTKIILVVEKIPVDYLMKGVQDSYDIGIFPIVYGRSGKEVSVTKSEKEVGVNLKLVDITITCEKISFSEVFKLFGEFAPGMFED